VHVILSGLPHTGEEAAEIPKMTPKLRGGVGYECIHVEPLTWSALAAREGDILQGSSQDHVTKAQRRAALALIQSRKLPPANDFRRHSPRASDWLFRAEGQLIYSSDNYAVCAVLVRNHLLRHSVACIEKSGGLHEFRPGPRDSRLKSI